MQLNILVILFFEPLDSACRSLIYAYVRQARRTAVISVLLAELSRFRFIRFWAVFCQHTKDLDVLGRFRVVSNSIQVFLLMRIPATSTMCARTLLSSLSKARLLSYNAHLTRSPQTRRRVRSYLYWNGCKHAQFAKK